MSKYNLTDILEQYKIGSGWTSDFDYDGMLNVGLKTSIDTPIEVLKKMSDDFEDVNYHRENHHLQDAIDAIEIGDMKEAEGRLNNFHVEIRKTQEEQGMDIEPSLGKFMDAKMDLDEDAMDNVMNVDKVASPDAKAHDYGAEIKGISDEDDTEEAYAHQTVLPLEEESRPHMSSDKFLRHIEKLHKDNQTQMAKEKEVKEVSSREGSRIEGLLNQRLKAKFLAYFEQMFYDLVEEDPFPAEDVIEHLSIEMMKHLDDIQAQGDKLAGIDQQEFTAIDEEEMGKDEKKYTDTVAKMLKDRILKDIPMDIIVDFVKTHGSDIRRMNNSEIKDEFEEFRSVNYDYIDENLKAHFNRFK